MSGAGSDDPYQVRCLGSHEKMRLQCDLVGSCRRGHRCCPATAATVAVALPAVFQVLGVPRNADGNAIQRAYKKKLSEVKGRDEAAQQRIEAAHSQIMMAALTSRLQVRTGGWAGQVGTGGTQEG